MPENLYFREPSTQTMLLDILFIYCKLNRDIGYRQGMHEVLAPVLWVVARDTIDPASLKANSEDQHAPDSLIIASFDSRYTEHDAFTLFGIIMQTAKSFYEMGGIEQAGAAATPNNSPIIRRSKRIHEEYLHRADPELAEHLAAIEILPQIFLIRWIRLLFGREFAFDELLTLWDILFAEDPALDLVDLICVSMLLRIRWQRKSLTKLTLDWGLIVLSSHRGRLLGSSNPPSSISRTITSSWATKFCYRRTISSPKSFDRSRCPCHFQVFTEIAHATIGRLFTFQAAKRKTARV